jgi:Transcription factor WhiB
MASNLPVHPLTGNALWARVVRQARCADSSLDPDEWFPASIEPATARHEAAAAIAVCAICPVRAQCLELSLRHWDIGQHGVWGGLVAADRARLRHRLPVDHGGRHHHRRFRNDRAAVIALVPGGFGGAGEVQ